jgi:hypothetical protein
MGDIAARESNAVAWNEAAVHYAAALAIASELRLRPFAAQCHLRIARLHRNPAMHAAMATAIDAFRTMGMTFDLARVTDSTSSTAE